MSPEEIELLQDAGQSFLINISVIVTESILYGLYLAIFAFGIHTLLKRPSWTKYTWVLFSFLTILFCFSTVDLALQVAGSIDLIRGCLIHHPEKSLLNRFQLAADSASGFNIALIFLSRSSGGGLTFIFADAVVVWRACVLWPSNKAAKVFLLALLSASFGSVIVSSTLETVSFANQNTVPTSSPTGIMLVLSQSLSLATNVVATILIGYKAYYHRQTMTTCIGLRSSRAGAILLILTESGVVFCILQIITLATTAADNSSGTPLDYVAGVLQQMAIFAAAAYPVIVLIIVDSRRSISNHTRADADSGLVDDLNARSLGIGTHVSFATRSGVVCSGGGGGDIMVESSTELPSGGDHSEGSLQSWDLEKGDGVLSAA